MTAISPRLRDAAVVVCLLVFCATPLMSGPVGEASLPLEQAIRYALRSGQLPLWNPFFLGGQPLLANGDAAVFYPPLVLSRLAPIAWTVPVVTFIHAALFATGMYILVRRIGETRIVAVLLSVGAVVAVTFARPLPVWWPTPAAVAWLPILVAATLASASRLSRLPSLTLVLAVTSVFLSGSLRGALFGAAAICGAAAFLAVWRWTPERLRLLIAQCAIALVTAAGLAAFQTFPQIGLASARASAQVVEPRLESALRAREDNPRWRTLLPALQGHVAVSTCDRVWTTDLVSAGIFVPDGWGPHVPAYARFTSLASGTYPVPDDPTPGLVSGATVRLRADLLAWLGVEYLIACDAPDPARWTPLQRVGDVAVFRATTAPLAPAWTCGPRAADHDEVEYALATHRFNGAQAAARRFVVHVRWTDRATDEARQRAENQFHLVPLRFLDQRTWQYELTDPSVENLKTLVLHPLIEDTAQINRHTFQPEALPASATTNEPRSEWLLGIDPCPAARQATETRNRPYRGRTVVRVDAPADGGVVVLPRADFPGLKAWVDGARSPLRRVNLALIAVPVNAGSHLIEVEYLPDSQIYGAATTGIALMACAGAWWTSRRRR